MWQNKHILSCFNHLRHIGLILLPISLFQINQIPGATAPKNQDGLKRMVTDGSAGGLVISKTLSFNITFSFLNQNSVLLIVATQWSSRGWVDTVLDPIFKEKYLGYNRQNNSGPLVCVGRSPEGPVSQIHSPHHHDGAPGIFQIF